MKTRIEKIAKLNNSICNGIARGEKLNCLAQLRRVDKYAALKAECFSTTEGTAEWVAYCEGLDFSPRHTAYDFFA